MRTVRTLLLIILALGLADCGGGSGDGADAPVAPLVDGDPAALAVSVLPATGPVGAAPADRSGNLLLTRIEVALTGTATVEQLNAAAAVVGATGISFSEAGSSLLTLIVPRQASGAALLALVEQLRTQAGIAFAAPAWQLGGFWLPGEGNGTAHDPELLQHLLPTRFPAAWNAAFSATGQRLRTTRNCTPAEATVIVADFFESLPAGAGSQFDALTGAQRFGRFDTGEHPHGWRVAATLAASFDDQRPTGATPLTDCVDFVLVDLSGLSYRQAVALVKRAIDAQPAFAPLIVNLSVGFVADFCGPNGDSVCTQLAVDTAPTSFLETQMWNRVMAAIDWATLTSATLDRRLLLVHAAGNEAAFLPENGGLGLLFTGIRQADLSSPWALATRLSSFDQLFDPVSELAEDLWTGAPAHSLLLGPASYQFLASELQQHVTRVPDLTNLLLVGAATHGVLPEQLSAWPASNEGSALLAVGEAVVVLDAMVDGTSFAAPQVSALSAYLWTVSELEENNRPTSETAELIKVTSTPGALLDAYAATLALDVVLPNFGPDIRQALLDVTGDDLFNEEDLDRFVTAYGLADPNTPDIPPGRDYGRFDLNGDGATGGIPTAAFDLDRNQLPAMGSVINTVDRAIEGYPVTFNEAALSDLQILCYYAYSTLYADGAPTTVQEQARRAMLGPDRCVGARLNTLFPAQVTGSASLDVTVEVPAGGGQYAAAPDMLVTFTPTCGSVSPASGRTDAEGSFRTTVTPTGCSSSVSVTALARANENTAVLAQKTVTAALGAGAVLENVSISTGQPAGTITAILTDSNGNDTTFSGPIGDAATVMAQVNAALSGVTEVTRNIGIGLWEPANLTVNAGSISVGWSVSVGAEETACASTISVTVGNIAQILGVGGCPANATVTAGNVGHQIVINGSNGTINITAGTVGRGIQLGNVMAANNTNMSVNVTAQAYNHLYITGFHDSTLNIQGPVELLPPNTTSQIIMMSSTNLTLGPVSGGVLNNVYIFGNRFTSAPSIAVGDIVHPGGTISTPNGSVTMENNSGLSLTSISMGDIDGNLRITGNEGFSDTDAANFVQARTVGGTTAITGNTP